MWAHGRDESRHYMGRSERTVQPDKLNPSQWHSYPSIQLWSHGLLHVTGLTSAEVTNRRNILFQFCTQQAIDPETMAEECRQGEDRIARRAYYLHLANQTPASLIVQSFLVHNGVNVFGDIVCMPSTHEQIEAEQGRQWIQASE